MKLAFFEGNFGADINIEHRNKKAREIIEQLELHNVILQKIPTCTIFILAPAAKMLDTSRFPIACTISQHDVILESICANNSIIIFFPA